MDRRFASQRVVVFVDCQNAYRHARDAFHNRLANQSVAVVAWEPLAGRRRYRVRLSGQFANNQPYCHWIDQAAYAAMQDTTDYTQPAGR